MPLPDQTDPNAQAVLSDLMRAKCAFQMRTIASAMDLRTPDDADMKALRMVALLTPVQAAD